MNIPRSQQPGNTNLKHAHGRFYRFLYTVYHLARYYYPAIRKRKLTWAIMQREWELHSFDWRYDTETATMQHLENLHIDSENIGHVTFYGPTLARVFTNVLTCLDGLGVDYSATTFVDVGSGKGKALLMAGQRPFRKIVGVEFAQDFCTLSEANVASYQRVTGVSLPISIICLDATKFPWPDSPLVVYCYNPFGPTVLAQIAAQLIETHRTNQRPIYFVYCCPVHNGLLSQIDDFHPVATHANFRCYRIGEKREATSP